jgi:hypothetical protein
VSPAAPVAQDQGRVPVHHDAEEVDKTVRMYWSTIETEEVDDETAANVYNNTL